MRALHGRLRFAGRTGVPRCVLFMPEAATPPANSVSAPLATCFARAVAASGERVLLVEADLHAMPLATQLGFRPSDAAATTTGILSVLDGADWRDATTPDHYPGLDLLLAPRRTDAQAQLSGVRFQNLLVEVRVDYDLVVLNAPAATTADAGVLVRRVDAAVLVVDGRLDRTVAHEAAARITAATHTPLVAVLLQRT